MSDERENFPAAVKDTIAGRAGYRCTLPECDKVTIGPGATSGETASVGVACHIYSASPNGPRGQGGLSSAQLKSAENGFWACANHSKLVDTNDGRRYPAGVLLGWRELHEARIHREMGGVKLPVHWIERLEILRSPVRPKEGPLFAPGQHLNLSRVTLLIGHNGSGKTALCEWLKGAADEEALWRWEKADMSLAMTIYNPDRHVFATENVDQNMVFRLDGDPVPFNPLPVAIQSLDARLHRGRGEEQSDVESMAASLGVTSSVLRRLVQSIKSDGTPFLEGMDVTDTDEILVRLPRHDHWDPLGLAGGSGEMLAAIALAAKHASHSALHVPTLLIIDGIWAFDPPNKAFVLGELLKLRNIQTLATLPDADKRLIWGGWSVATIEDGPAGGTIHDA